jgi:hypothetical protein
MGAVQRTAMSIFIGPEDWPAGPAAPASEPLFVGDVGWGVSLSAHASGTCGFFDGLDELGAFAAAVVGFLGTFGQI